MSTEDINAEKAVAATLQTYRLQNSRCVEDPTAELNVNYILEERETLALEFEHEESKSGKWILFVRINSMFSMWTKSCYLYREGKLEGVTSLKASTAKDNPRKTGDDNGVIIFHCGPSDDKEKILRYGMNIVMLLKYFNDKGYIPYKTNEQSAKGTRATGNQVNCLYKLPVARRWSEYQQPGTARFWRDRETYTPSSGNWRSKSNTSHLEFWRSNDSDRTSWRSPAAGHHAVEEVETVGQHDSPTSRLDTLWLTEPEDFYKSRTKKPSEVVGHWITLHPSDKLDSAWMKARKLFRDGELPEDVVCVQASTQLQNYKNNGRGVIKFRCIIKDEKEQMLMVGKRLAECLELSNDTRQIWLQSGRGTLITL
ncbi:uncharacterized protein LOC108678049 isoform X2 [Hyalella azteca]|uniref:Uncharacterized protein LOC108678049 isoform X2 n=1 Tax=Hyalella azteca TaxID=294128 RepID=A0A8B7P7F0_HYAAZ|nr:uncharacterized protein LOC108678049 isoform X2 [Hyalella azteca]